VAVFAISGDRLISSQPTIVAQNERDRRSSVQRIISSIAEDLDDLDSAALEQLGAIVIPRGAEFILVDGE
jgi:hypothetical protein